MRGDFEGTILPAVQTKFVSEQECSILVGASVEAPIRSADLQHVETDRLAQDWRSHLTIRRQAGGGLLVCGV
jgi:hypothetical protein